MLRVWVWMAAHDNALMHGANRSFAVTRAVELPAASVNIHSELHGIRRLTEFVYCDDEHHCLIESSALVSRLPFCIQAKLASPVSYRG